jgi:hypothetical protein
VQPGRAIVKVYRRKTPAENFAYMVTELLEAKKFHGAAERCWTI